MEKEDGINEFMSLDEELVNSCQTKKEYVEKASALYIRYFGLRGAPVVFIEGTFMCVWDYKRGLT